jgi:hypothetical protein
MTKQPFISSVCVLAIASVASAKTVSFDESDGYVLGTSLVDQPGVGGPDWKGNGSLYTVTSLGGGNGAAQFNTSVENSAFANNRFVPDADFLGTTDTTTADKLYAFGFDLRFDSIGSNDGFRLDHRINIGGTDSAPMVRFQLFGNSRLQYNDGTADISAQNINGASLNLDDTGGRFVPVEGIIDINAGTYDLIVDGVPQGTDLALANIPADFGQVTLQLRTNDAGALGYSLDNLQIDGTVIPEPASATALGLVGLVAMRRRR